MEGSFGTQKGHYGLRKVIARIKAMEILFIFFGIHTDNVVSLTRSDAVQQALAAKKKSSEGPTLWERRLQM